VISLNSLNPMLHFM